MVSKKNKASKAPRLFVDMPLSSQGSVTLSKDQGRYLIQVMRLGVGDAICLFNELCGEWSSVIKAANRQTVVCQVLKQRRLPTEDYRLKGLTLAFSPLKPSIMGFLMEKATELGVESLQLLEMERTQHKAEKQGKWQVRTIEASEQSERLSVPEILSTLPLIEWAQGYEGQILWAYERSGGMSKSLLHYAKTPSEKVAFLVGPEGGFSETEITFLSGLENAHSITLGDSILRAETASLMMLSLWRGRTSKRNF